MFHVVDAESLSVCDGVVQKRKSRDFDARLVRLLKCKGGERARGLSGENLQRSQYSVLLESECYYLVALLSQVYT